MTEQATPQVDQMVKWDLDHAHTEIQFKVKHMMVTTVTGVFRKFDAVVEIPGNNLADAKIEFHADVDSISTNNDQRDGHLKSTDFFSGEKHPQLTFVKTGARKVDDEGNWVLTGDLTMNGVTRSVDLDVEWGGTAKDGEGKLHAGASITGKINRKDWNINWNVALEAGGVLVGETVRIACNVEMVKQG